MSFQSVLDPAGPQSASIGGLWWFLFAVCAIVFVLVPGFLYQAIRPATGGAQDRRMARAVAGATAATVLILFVFLVASVSTGKTVSTFSSRDQLEIEVTGHQWWWEARYPDPVSSQIVTTANEIHVPVGRPVMFRLTSGDVIHSFWAPNLHGKRDLIPSRVTTITMRADHPGVFRGQCAEFCGYQHAHMGFYIIAERPDQFEAWLRNQRLPAAEPAATDELRGRQVFLNGPCVLCHSVRGTAALGLEGPDLTHIASRRTIAAAALPNTAGYMAGWLVDPQNIKPGTRMPSMHINAGDMQPLLAWLGSLK